VHVYDRIEIPPIKPDVTRVRLFGGRCACCGERALAAAPAGLEPGSPFGKSIEALVIYLHYAQAIGLERLRLVLAEIFGLSIPLDALASGSEGALCNILARASAPLSAAAHAIAAQVTAAVVIASDETSVRVMKKTQWEWAELAKVPSMRSVGGRQVRGSRVRRHEGPKHAGEVDQRLGIGDVGHEPPREAHKESLRHQAGRLALDGLGLQA